MSLARESPRGNGIAVGSPGCRGPVDLRTSGVGQPEQARDLVERLAGGVVHRLAEQLDVGGEVAHEQQRRVPAAHEQGDRGVLERRRVGVEDVGGDVPDEVVDGVERRAERDGERLRGADADHEGSGEARAGGDRDRVEVAAASHPPRRAPPRSTGVSASRCARAATSGTTPP